MSEGMEKVISMDEIPLVGNRDLLRQKSIDIFKQHRNKADQIQKKSKYPDYASVKLNYMTRSPPKEEIKKPKKYPFHMEEEP